MGGSHTDCGSATLLTHETLITSQLPSLRIQHYWILEAELDIKWGRDIHAKAYFGNPNLSQLRRGKNFWTYIMDE